MIVKKITTGFVVQVFDTNTGRFTSQKFVAGDDAVYEDENGKTVPPSLLSVNGKELCRGGVR